MATTVTQSHPGLPFCNLADTKGGNTYPPRGDVLGNSVGFSSQNHHQYPEKQTVRNEYYIMIQIDINLQNS
jgi:hypothetical protein